MIAACKARLAGLVAGAPRSGFLDFFVDSPMTRDGGNFDDLEHSRAAVAREIEAAITHALAGAPTAAK
jgi:hypothetical protein